MSAFHRLGLSLFTATAHSLKLSKTQRLQLDSNVDRILSSGQDLDCHTFPPLSMHKQDFSTGGVKNKSLGTSLKLAQSTSRTPMSPQTIVELLTAQPQIE